MTAGIRGNNPGIIEHKAVTLDPVGPDGAPAMRDAAAAENTGTKNGHQKTYR